MKLIVNYDLLSKIATAKTGFTLDRNIKQGVTNTLIIEGLSLPFGIAAGFTKEQFMIKLLGYFLLQMTVLGITDIILSKWQKQTAIMELILLSRDLKNININTNYHLLVQAYKYDVRYKLEYNDSNFSKIKQEKYIMLPVYEDGEEKELSIVQEHIIGSKDYELSIGEPQIQKKLKLASNPI